MGRGGAGMGIYHTCPTPFNFLNGTGMRFVLNKRDGIGTMTTYPVAIPTYDMEIFTRQSDINCIQTTKSYPKSNIRFK